MISPVSGRNEMKQSWLSPTEERRVREMTTWRARSHFTCFVSFDFMEWYYIKSGHPDLQKAKQVSGRLARVMSPWWTRDYCDDATSYDSFSVRISIFYTQMIFCKFYFLKKCISILFLYSLLCFLGKLVKIWGNFSQKNTLLFQFIYFQFI